jgi:protein phosphatase
MHPALPTIYCPNPKCRTANKGGGRFCQACGSTLPQRYLRVAAGFAPQHQAGDLLLDRYLFCGSRVVLDTQPGLPLGNVFELDQTMIPYLKLFQWRLHIPQIYSLSALDQGSSILVLLEGVPLTPEDFFDAESLAFASKTGAVAAESFVDAWSKTPVLRQLNWLWQMSRLWTPLLREHVASSLIHPNGLRVEGSLLRLVELTQDDEAESLPLKALGEFWHQHCLFQDNQWSQPFNELCDRLITGHIASADELRHTFEEWLSQEQQDYRVQIDIATRTDTGPLREHNEDACYPTHNTLIKDTSETLAIVCDGVGGHASGEVASATAIAALTDHLRPLLPKTLGTEDLMFELESAVDSANDLITQQNDAEQRQDRDRMGTTVVMGLYKDQNLYITNVGDSRAYLITAKGCYQVTVDDDIASREVRLGYLPYREAQRQPGAGALIQALGMVPSSMLHPSVTRFFLDSDCIFLLCSDGLSDFERVETLWQEELLPVLNGTKNLAEGSKQLVQWANQLNGYDNVTVALMHCRVSKSMNPPTTGTLPATQGVPPSTTTKTVLQRTQRTQRTPKSAAKLSMPWKGMFAGFLGVFVIGGVLSLFIRNTFKQPPGDGTPSVRTTAPSASPTSENSPVIPTAMALEVGKLYVLQPQNTLTTPQSTSLPIVLKQRADGASPDLGVLPQESVFQVMNFSRKLNTEQVKEEWVQLQICKIPESSTSDISSSPPPAKPATTSPSPTSKPISLGTSGYLQSAVLTGQIQPIAPDDPQLSQFQANCKSTSSSSSPG